MATSTASAASAAESCLREVIEESVLPGAGRSHS